MSSTRSLVNGEQPEHASAPGLLDSKSEPGSTNAPSTAPDVAYEKKVGRNTTDDHDERQEEPKPDDAKPNEYPSGARLVCIILVLVLAIFLVSLDLTIVATAPWTILRTSVQNQQGLHGTGFILSLKFREPT